MSDDVATVAVPLSSVERAEAALLPMPQVEGRLEHHFAPGVYCRQFTMPSATIFIGHEHKTEHLNVVLKGHAIVLIDGVRHDIQAPCVFKSPPGVRKVLLILEETVWATIHPTNETDLVKLEELLITKSRSWLDYRESEIRQLAMEMKNGGAECHG